MLPVAGDWNGRGRAGVGLYDPSCSRWFLSTQLGGKNEVEQFDFGPAGGAPVVGDWDGDGVDEVGVFVTDQGQAFLARSNRAATPCWSALVDPPGARPIAAGRKTPTKASDKGRQGS